MVIECSVGRQNLSKWRVLKYGFDIIFQKKNHSATNSLFHQKPTTPLHYYTIILIHLSRLPTHGSLVTSSLSAFLGRQVIFDRKLYREVVWSYEINPAFYIIYVLFSFLHRPIPKYREKPIPKALGTRLIFMS